MTYNVFGVMLHLTQLLSQRITIVAKLYCFK